MPELTGSLSSIDLVPLVRFVSALGKSGDLLLSDGHWIGCLSLEQGRLVGAAVEDEQGQGALDFIALALRDGSFEFSEGPPILSANIGSGGDPLLRIEEQAARQPTWLSHIPGPTSVPHILDLADAPDDADVLVSRIALSVLLELDGRRSVRELAARHGLLRVVSSLALLRQLHLVDWRSVDAALPAERDDTSHALGPPSQHFTRGGPAARLPTSAQPLGITVAIARSLVERALSVVRSDHVQAVLATAVFVLFLRAVVQNFRVQGVSMEPTFNAGQVLVVNRAAYFHVDGSSPAAALAANRQGSTGYVFGGPQHGDVAVFTAPPQPDTDYIKRIIGLPGDSVLIRDGHVFVNGNALDEPYVHFPADYTFPEGGQPLVVPDAEYFVLGDNRPESFDSHAGWLVPVDDLIGRAWIRYWPPDAMGMVAPGPAMMTYAVAEQRSSQP